MDFSFRIVFVCFLYVFLFCVCFFFFFFFFLLLLFCFVFFFFFFFFNVSSLFNYCWLNPNTTRGYLVPKFPEVYLWCEAQQTYINMKGTGARQNKQIDGHTLFKKYSAIAHLFQANVCYAA